MQEYFNYKSLTWWVGASFVLMGVFIASEPLHNLETISKVLQKMTILTPALMIQTGLGWIGIRAAIGRK